jgi:DNA-binding IclR family transcriptional regulator
LDGSRIAVVDKVARVFEVLAESRQGVTPSELAAVLDSNRSSAFRLLRSLENVDLLYRESGTGRYRLGMKFFQYGELVRTGSVLVDVADPTARRLSHATRQSVSLVIREGYGVRCIHRVAGPDIETSGWRVGAWLPMHLGAAPRAILSTLSEPELSTYFAEPGERVTLNGPVSEDDLREEIALIRRRGYALSNGDLTAGVCSLGVVVRDSRSSPICAISVAGLEHHYRDDALEHTATAVTIAAAELGQLLGGGPRP